MLRYVGFYLHVELDDTVHGYSDTDSLEDRDLHETVSRNQGSPKVGHVPKHGRRRDSMTPDNIGHQPVLARLLRSWSHE